MRRGKYKEMKRFKLIYVKECEKLNNICTFCHKLSMFVKRFFQHFITFVRSGAIYCQVGKNNSLSRKIKCIYTLTVHKSLSMLFFYNWINSWMFKET